MNGDSVWTKTFSGSAEEIGYGVMQTEDEGYLIAGYSESYGAGGSDVYLIKTDSNGDSVWSQTYGGSEDEVGYYIQSTEDGGYVITGYAYSYSSWGADVYVIKTDMDGDTIWTKTLGGSDWDYGLSIQQTSDGGYIIAGETESYGAGGDDVYLIRLDSEGTLVEDFGNNTIEYFTLHPPSPNPFNNSTTISFDLPAAGNIDLSVYDIAGRMVQALGTGHWALGQHRVVWDAEGMSSGIYLVRLTVDPLYGGQAKGQQAVKKAVLLK